MLTGKSTVIAEVKRELRAQQAAARNQLTESQRMSLSSLVCQHAWDWLETKGITSLMAYVSFRSELDTRPLIIRAWEGQREVILPRVHPGSGTMSLHRVNSWNELEPGGYGILEPRVSGDLQAPEVILQPAVVFVPGLAFDLRGGRLGYGRGYYDRDRKSVV